MKKLRPKSLTHAKALGIRRIFQHHKCGIQDPYEGCPDPRCKYFAIVDPTPEQMREAATAAPNCNVRIPLAGKARERAEGAASKETTANRESLETGRAETK